MAITTKLGIAGWTSYYNGGANRCGSTAVLNQKKYECDETSSNRTNQKTTKSN